MSTETMTPGLTTEPAEIVDPLDTRVRIEELKLLENGWLDGQGVAPSHDGLDWLANAFDALYADETPFPYLFPTPEGRVLAEWSMVPRALSLEIDLGAKSGQWHSLNLDTDVEATRDLDLTKPSDWEWIVEQICSIRLPNLDSPRRPGALPRSPRAGCPGSPHSPNRSQFS